MASIFATQPFTSIYVTIALIWELTRIPIWLLLYILPAGRPHSEWTYGQALRIRAARSYCTHVATIRIHTELSMQPGKEGHRFVIVQPPTPKQWTRIYQGPTDDPEVKPEPIGAVWHPQPLQHDEIKDAEVVLHFHGGAYVYGHGRDDEQAWPASQWRKFAKVTHVLTPSYRLSSNPGGRFPAALQDAITSYLYLLNLGIPASRITVSGDSAGGNLALSLLRYIAEHGAATGLPWPACVWLWSPWVDISAGLDKQRFCSSANASVDIVGWPFATWGATTMQSKHYSAKGPYLTVLGNPFASKSPLFVTTGGKEVIYFDIVRFANEMSALNTVQLLDQADCPHDIMVSGVNIGFEKEAVVAATEAGRFLRANRYVAKQPRSSL